MRVLGGLLIFAACSGAGVYRAMQLKRRVRTLHGLLTAFELMRSEICSRLTPLTQAIGAADAIACSAVKPFFQELLCCRDKIGDVSFGGLWRECAETKLTELRDNELAAVISLGGTLGRYDAPTQNDAICACIDILKVAYDKMSGEYASAAKTSIGAGISLGAMIAIALF